jgi:beta-phosphoglucomutase-like phosphatase (HAD superfamily)
MIKAVIFDVDGTLSETEELHRQAFNLAFEEKGLPWHWDQDEYRRLLNVTGGKERIRFYIEQKERKQLKATIVDDFIRSIHALKTEKYTGLIAEGRTELRPGIRELISAAIDRGIRLAIATTTSLPNVEALLKSTYGDQGMQMFEVICAGDSVKAKKPAPDIYLAALDQLNLDPGDCIALEDSRNGLLSATAAGITTIVTPGIYTEDQCFDEAALIINDLTEHAHQESVLAGMLV